MKVYAHFIGTDKDGVQYRRSKDGFQYRWRTLLQFGNSWDVIGSVVMKNPGSAKPTEGIITECEREHLAAFASNDLPWYVFSPDNTMRMIEIMFTYSKNDGKPLNGVIQIFNLFNIRDADLNKALDKSQTAVETVFSTIDDDLRNIKEHASPIYIGWGGLGNQKSFHESAKRYFDFIRNEMGQHYLFEKFSENRFYHPQYLMGRGKNRFNSQWLLKAFSLNTTEFCFEGMNYIHPVKLETESILNVFKQTATRYKWYENKRCMFYPGLQVTFDKKTINIRFVERAKNGTFNSLDYQDASHQKTTKILLEEFGYCGPEKAWIGRKKYNEFGTSPEVIANGIITELEEIKTVLKCNNIDL